MAREGIMDPSETRLSSVLAGGTYVCGSLFVVGDGGPSGDDPACLSHGRDFFAGTLGAGGARFGSGGAGFG